MFIPSPLLPLTGAHEVRRRRAGQGPSKHAGGGQRGRGQDHDHPEPAGRPSSRPLTHGHQLLRTDIIKLTAGG